MFKEKYKTQKLRSYLSLEYVPGILRFDLLKTPDSSVHQFIIYREIFISLIFN